MGLNRNEAECDWFTYSNISNESSATGCSPTVIFDGLQFILSRHRTGDGVVWEALIFTSEIHSEELRTAVCIIHYAHVKIKLSKSTSFCYLMFLLFINSLETGDIKVKKGFSKVEN